MKDRLSAARSKIDALDRSLLALLNRRFALARSLAPLKKKIRDPKREAVVLGRARSLSRPPFKAAGVKVFKEIIRQSRLLQVAK